ncbi:MAG: DNA adenine methylase [Proteobacteria bacterium]|nr:DNA adenine methylase [Pseudomonadota bacterium]
MAKPLLKWAGGKRKLLPEIKKRFPKKHNNYYEPFIGGGAVFFDLIPKNSIISDLNTELINVYTSVRDDVEGIINILSNCVNDENEYYRIRNMDKSTDSNYSSYIKFTPIQRAARFIYMNRTCFNGLCRYNRSGHFNVPFGKYANPIICDAITLRSCSKALQNTKYIILADYATVTKNAVEGDFIYFDPPYDGTFTSYSGNDFGEKEQTELSNEFRRLDSIGVNCLLSNMDTPLIEKLYKGFKVSQLGITHTIGSKAEDRMKKVEVLITNQ